MSHSTYSSERSQQFAERIKRQPTFEADLLAQLNENTSLIDPDTIYESESLLHLVLSKHYLRLYKQLVELGADANKPFLAGNTALHDALNSGNVKYPQVALLLLRHGARTSIPNEMGYTPVHFYTFQNTDDIAYVELEDALVNAPDFNPNFTSHVSGETLLDKCCRIDKLSEFGRRLLDEGAHIPASMINHAETGRRYHQAQQRWRTFEENPDVRALCHADIVLLSNYDILEKVFIPSLWQDHPEMLQERLADMPNWMSHEVLNLQPGLLRILSPDKAHPIIHAPVQQHQTQATPTPSQRYSA